MSNPISQDFFFTEDLDLTDEQILTTQDTYLKFAGNYVFNIERAEGALEKARPYTLDPFLATYKKLKLSNPILFAGCGSCRDLQVSAKIGISSYGIDTSSKMLDIARKIGVSSPLRVMNILNLDFPVKSLDGVFCETALSHIKKTDTKIALKEFYKVLSPNGIALLGFRLGNGNVYYTQDEVGGRRYNTTFSKEEAVLLITNSGFNILSTQISPHPVIKRPNFVDFIIKKQS